MTVPRTHYHHGDLRRALIEDGTALLREQGIEGLTLRAVARRAGVSHSALYRHFPDKAALLAAIATEGFEALVTALDKVAAHHPDDPATQLTEAGVAYVLLALHWPQRAQLMFDGPLDPDTSGEALRSASDKAFAALVRIIDLGQRAGIYAPGDPRELALSAWALVHGLAMLMIAGCIEETDSEERAVKLTRGACRTYQAGLLLAGADKPSPG